MYCILLVGMTGQGKSYFVKKYTYKRACLIFDVQNEYNDLPTDNRLSRSRTIDVNVKRFFSIVKNKRNTVCVFEEATIFFEGKTGEELRTSIVGKRHSGNVFLFCFHSISAIPPRILQLTDYVVLFKTNDEGHQVKRKYPSLYKTFLILQSMKDKSFKIIKTL